jgi:hypothetical protein
MAVTLSALRASYLLTPGRFLVLISVRGWVNHRAMARLAGLDELKNPMISKIQSATFGLYHSASTHYATACFSEHLFRIRNSVMYIEVLPWWLGRIVSSGIKRRVVRWKSTDVSEEYMSLPSSGLKNKSSRLCLSPGFTLVSCSPYSSNLKMEATCSSETSVDFQRTTFFSIIHKQSWIANYYYG